MSTIKQNTLTNIFTELSIANNKFSTYYPGDGEDAQPIHTLYGGAQLYKAQTAKKIGELALKSFNKYAPDAQTLAQALDLPGDENLWQQVHARVMTKLETCAVEDYRIDFEDGYGNRPDAEEDATATFTAKEFAKSLQQGISAPFMGIRIKPFTEELKQRSVRTLDIFISTLINANNGKVPKNFIITLPKVSIPEQVTALVKILDHLEQQLGLNNGELKIEIMIETTQALLSQDGLCHMPLIYKAANGRCRGAHFGTYDYTASFDITAAHQVMDHRACDFALQMMKLTFAGTGVWLSNGATSVMPIGDTKTIHKAWKLSFDNIINSLEMGYYQGWDLNPAQIPIRFVACYTFFLQNLEQASIRLTNFIDKAAQATLVGDIFDDAATGQGLLNFFLRALNSGAISAAEIEATGLSLAEVRTKSFVKIVANRTAL
ncbi:MAG: aldolase/citrate lyase family protein [Proteobacteria bacterium]|nr:aldolase/citrate lyase family protein [Pseudomonadota bacterium]